MNTEAAPRRPSAGAACAAAVALACMVLLAIITWSNPWWGLMDDHANLQGVKSIQAAGLWRATLDFLRGDVTTGMFRPYYPALVLLLWGPAEGRPLWAFLVNVPLVLGAAFLFEAGWRRTLADMELRVPPAGWLVGFSLAFFWFHDQFWYPSLQEKQVTAGVGMCLLVLAWADRTLRGAAWWAAVTAAMLLAACTKGQFAVFLPAMVLAQVARDAARAGTAGLRAHARTAWVTLLGALVVLAFAWLARQGSYTRGMDASSALRNMVHPVAVGVLVVVAACGVMGVVAFRQGRGGVRGLAGALFHVATLGAFVVIMMPRGIHGAILGIMAPVIGAALWDAPWSSGAWPRLLLAGTVVMAPVMTTFRAVRAFSRSNDLRRIVFSPEVRELHARGEVIHVPCDEGSTAMRYYFHQHAGVPVAVRRESSPWSGAGASTYWFGDARNCRLQDVLAPAEMARLRPLVAPNLAGGFMLAELPPANADAGPP